MTDDACLRLADAVSAAQRVLARYIEPGSGIAAEDAINALLEVLDNRELIAAQREIGA